jgi:eukaryotic-like serine/threonine-protein kinase
MIPKSSDGAKQAELAMEWLKMAVAAGFKNVEQMKKDRDLDALRDREDFKKLLAELEAGKEKK